MLREVALMVLSSRFSVAVTQNLNGVAGFFQKQFAGTDNLRIVSIILLLLAFILFLFLVIILYIKSLLNFIKSESESISSNHQNLSESIVREQDLEKELAKELEKSEQKQAEHLRKQKTVEDERLKRAKAEEELKKNSRRKKKLDLMAGDSAVAQQNSPFGSAGKMRLMPQGNSFARGFAPKELDPFSVGIGAFAEPEPPQALKDMPRLIMNMFGRGIDAAKIAQTIKNKCGDLATEEDVIQFVDAIRNFISLCNNHKFLNLPDAMDLPTVEEALYMLAQNQPTYSMQLMQALMNNAIDRATTAKIIQKRDLGFLEASNYACIFGTLALAYDENMSKSGYETAVEFSRKNVNAWSCVADTYSKNHDNSKAIWAYQHLLSIADKEHHAHQIANANKKLAQFYYDQGDVNRATQMYNMSNDYYDAIGINKGLTMREKEIVKVIESKVDDEVQDTVNRLLKIPAQKQRDYA